MDQRVRLRCWRGEQKYNVFLEGNLHIYIYALVECLIRCDDQLKLEMQIKTVLKEEFA